MHREDRQTPEACWIASKDMSIWTVQGNIIPWFIVNSFIDCLLFCSSLLPRQERWSDIAVDWMSRMVKPLLYFILERIYDTFILSPENRLGVSEYRVQRRIFGPKVTEWWEGCVIGLRCFVVCIHQTLLGSSSEGIKMGWTWITH
jgi:hypothetical protein